MNRVVVTGGAGFIGSNLVEELSKQGHHVRIIDDLSTGRIDNIQSFLSQDNVEFTEASVTDLPLLQRLLEGVEYVFHQAALPSVPRSIENPVDSHDVNATGTLNVLLASRDNGVKKVVYASSSSTYGDTPTLPKREDMPPNPLSPYAVTKLAGEFYCRVFQDVYGLSTACLRYFNVYGPRQDPNSPYSAVIPRFIGRILKGQPPVIFGDGEQTRDFTFVKDAVQANIKAVDNDACGVYNVGGGERISIGKLARLVISIVGGDIEPVYQAARSGDVLHSLADITRARSFGYEPRYGLGEGLTETIRSFQHEI